MSAKDGSQKIPLPPEATRRWLVEVRDAVAAIVDARSG